MVTKIQLEDALKDAMRARDDVTKRTLRMILSAIRLSEVDKGTSLDEAAIMSILQKEVKLRLESIADAQAAGRPEMEEALRAEIAIVESYLPKQLSAAELDEMARQAVSEVGATSQKEMGKVMKVLLPRLQGRATGDQASQAVRKLLS